MLWLVNLLFFFRGRHDGDAELHAFYILKTHDDHLIAVKNRVLATWDPPGQDSKMNFRLTADFEAPTGTVYADMLHHNIMVGMLSSVDYKGFVNVNIWKLV